MNKKERARKLTIKIFEVILEEHNGYTKQEIKDGNLGEECETDSSFIRIQELIKEHMSDNKK